MDRIMNSTRRQLTDSTKAYSQVQIFCGECKYLASPGNEQAGGKEHYICAKYNKRVYSKNSSPHICTLPECIEDFKRELQNITILKDF